MKYPAIATALILTAGTSGATARPELTAPPAGNTAVRTNVDAARTQDAATRYECGAIGFANYADMGLQGTTGGMGGKIVRVSTREEFARHAASEEPCIIILDADLKGHYDYSANPKKKHDTVSVGSNKTIIGAGSGARLDSLGLDINGQSNIIIRNLRISKADPDAIALRNSHHIWIDHCDLSSLKEETEANDGLLDFTYGSSYMTVSWCRFHDHDKSSICSSGSRNIADYGRQRVTYHHNAFVNCTQRNPRIGYGLGHIFNDFNDTNTLYAIGVFARVVVNVENSYFKNCKEAFNQMYSADYGDYDTYWGFLNSEGNIFEKSGGTEGNSNGFDVGKYYDHTFAMDAAADLPALLGAAGCIAGLEGDLIPFPGNGAKGLPCGTRIAVGEVEGASGYTFEIGEAPGIMSPADPAVTELKPGTTYYWRCRVSGGPHDGRESGIFRFTTAPAAASYPFPADGERHAQLREINGATKPTAPLILRWEPAFDAVEYTVSIADNEAMDGAESGTTSSPLFSPGSLQYGRSYYWRVDVTRADGTTVTGPVWTFSSDVSYAHEGRNEVENAVRAGLCFPERHASEADWFAASGGWCNVGDEGPGSMSFVWDGNDGFYDLTTAYFDESSGKSWLGIFVGEKQADSWTATENKNRMAEHLSKSVFLARGDELRLEFRTDSKMRTRTDYIDVRPSVSGVDGIAAGEEACNDGIRVYSVCGTYLGDSTAGLAPGVYIVNNRKVLIR